MTLKNAINVDHYFVKVVLNNGLIVVTVFVHVVLKELNPGKFIELYKKLLINYK
jgi:hypothetical protein